MYVITLPGVLQKTNEAPNPQGIALYRSLAATGRLAVLCGPDENKAEWFLATNNLTDHVNLVPESLESHPTAVGRRRSQIAALRAQGTHIEFVVDPDPEVIAGLHEDGLATLLYLHPQFSQPSFRPDYKSEAKPWSQMVAVVDYQMKMKATQVMPSLDGDEEGEE